MFGRKKKKELAAAADALDEEALEKKEGHKSIIKSIGGLMDKVNDAIPVVTDFYTHWIKPVYDNRAQIKRRLNALSTAISLIFFLIYVPLVLFGKISEGLGFGQMTALYVCMAVYVVMLVALLVVTLATDRSNSTEASKKIKFVSKIILLVVRVASLAISITALVITSEGGGGALSTLAMVFAIISIIFTVFPLLFGGILGFFRWLISPAKIKRTFAFVALEWNDMLTDSEKQLNKQLKKVSKKYAARINVCLDKYLLPALGKKKIEAVDGDDILKALSSVPGDYLNMCEWLVKTVFVYATDCGYIESDPCLELGLEGDIDNEAKKK